jgi:hypothetical protein
MNYFRQGGLGGLRARFQSPRLLGQRPRRENAEGERRDNDLGAENE